MCIHPPGQGDRMDGRTDTRVSAHTLYTHDSSNKETKRGHISNMVNHTKASSFLSTCMSTHMGGDTWCWPVATLFLLSLTSNKMIHPDGPRDRRNTSPPSYLAGVTYLLSLVFSSATIGLNGGIFNLLNENQSRHVSFQRVLSECKSFAKNLQWSEP